MSWPHLTRRILACAMVLAALVALPGVASAQPKEDQTTREILALNWQRGPTEARISSIATINIPFGQLFLDSTGTRRFLELNQNPPRDNHYTLAARDFSWFAVFFFEKSGYVRDDEKLDADALLKSLQEGDGRGNDERKRLGMPALHTDGWHVAPHYDLDTKRLEWGVRLRSESGQSLVNYTTRVLGRHGVMHATLVSDPRSLDRDIRDFKNSLTGYSFASGEKYSEYRSGDRVAEYGLAALVLGGAAAVATKTGFGKAIGKFVVLGVVALASAVAAFFRKFRRS